MNLKNFPKRLDSKTSCLRITVPENLDLALEGLIRKVLREQPKMDDIYGFAADYFDMLLKIREKVGTKFAADQLCPFHNDEDAHEMVKLASVFAKPGTPKSKTLETKKTKNPGTKSKREPSKLTEKSDKKVQNVKRPVPIRKKPEQLTRNKTDLKLNETKPERPKTLKLEPKTEDVGDDEEFLKSDSIKALVEKELMDAAKPKDKEKERKDDANEQQNEKPEEGAANEELCVVVDKDNIKTEVKTTEELVNKEKEENTESQGATEKKQEDVNEKGESKAVEKTENQIEKVDKAPEEAAIEAGCSTEDTTGQEIKKDLGDDEKSKHDVKTETQNESPEIETETDHIKSVEISAVEEESQRPEEEIKEEVQSSNTEHAEINQEVAKETTEPQVTTTDKLLEEKVEEVENAEKEKRAEEGEAQDTSNNEGTQQPSLAEELNLNPDELCTVVDVLSIKPLEKDESNAEQVKETKVEEPESKNEEEVEEVKTKRELPTNEEKEVIEIQKSTKAAEKSIEEPLPNKAEEANTSSPFVKVTDVENPLEKLKEQLDSGDNKSDTQTTEKEVRESGEIKPVPCEDQKTTEDNLNGNDNETEQVTEDNPGVEEKAGREESSTTTENEAKHLENQLKLEEKSLEALEKEKPEKEEAGKETQVKTEEKEIKFVESSETDEEALQQMKTEIKSEEQAQNHRKTEDNDEDVKLEPSSVKDDQQPPENSSNIKEERTVPGEIQKENEFQSEEVKPEEETVIEEDKEDKTKVTNEENIYDKQKDDVMIAEEADPTVKAQKEEPLILQDPIKPSEESEEPEIGKTNAVESTDVDTKKRPNQFPEEEFNTVIPGDEQCMVVDAQNAIKIEEAEENPHPEGVQIKTIQTHYYDTLQVPEQVTKEYRVHSVKNGNVVDNLLNVANVALSSDKDEVRETSTSPLDPPKQEDEEQYKRDLEDSLMTPSSSSSLNLSELSVQTISEMFLNSEKQYSALDKEERRYVTKTGEKCGDERNMGKREVEEIIHKTIVPSRVGATPVAPREDAEINEEMSIETSLKSEKKQEASEDSNERGDSSNEGKSIDSDTPIISVEVKTVIESQILEDEEEGKNDGGPSRESESDVQIRIEATIDIPEGVVVDVREEKGEIRQLANDAPPASETVPKDSQTSSEESESTISSAATEIKRNDSTKRHFSSTRTLITTKSLDLDKRNPLLKTRSLSSFRQGVTDFEVWNAIEKELEEAATKIQSNFRGYKTRKKLQRENAVHITTEESSCSTTPVEPEQESREEHQQSTGEFHDSIVLSEHPR